ncbi:MAG: hypothetical protein ABI905_03890, partial [Betaproteobacteria bacterium]
MNNGLRKLMIRLATRTLVLGALGFATASHADICQFIPTLGAWDLPGNWSNCTNGNGATPGTPGPADRAEITGRTVTLGPSVYNVGDLYLGTSTIQGVGIGSSALNVVASGTIAWGSGSYTFQDLTVILTSTSTIPAANGPMFITDSQMVLTAPLTTLLADSITVTGANAKITNNGIFNPSTSLTMASGGQFENGPSGAFSPVSPFTINGGSFVNNGAFYLNPGAPVTMNNAAAFAQPDPNAAISGDGSLTGTGQVLTLAAGAVRGNMTLTFQNIINTGAKFQPGGPGTVGTITVNGNYTQQQLSPTQFGSVEFDLAGVGSVDQLLVSGTVTLGGSIYRTALGTFAPPVGTVLDVIIAGAVTGGFDQGSEAILFDAPRRYIEIIGPTKVSLRSNETVWVVGDSGDAATGASSLRAAITLFNAENSGGCVNAPYTIHFGLPMGESTLSPATSLPNISGCTGLTIDGYTQAGASANTSTSDWDGVLTLTLDGSGCTGCSGITFMSANGTVQGVNFTNWDRAVQVGGSADGTHIYGNYFFQGGYGVFHAGPVDVRIGQSSNAAARNVFVHAGASGIFTNGQTSGAPLHIENNLIGAGAGLFAGPNAKGIDVFTTNNVLVIDNIIANNGKGIVVATGTGIDYSGNNQIYGNGIGVDLGDDGPTANDDVSPPYDTDSGGNLQLNYPVITSIVATGAGNADVNFTLKSAASQNFHVFVCRNPGFGTDCEQTANNLPVSTDASGVFSGTLTISGVNSSMPVTMYTKALSGPKAGNMSELSPAMQVPPPPPSFSLLGSGVFPDTLVGNTSMPQGITIANSPNAPLTINVISVTPAGTFFDTTNGPPPDAGHYCGFGSSAAGAPLTGAPKVINAESFCNMNFVFKPTAPGPFSATLQIVSDATGSPHTLTLSGNGVATPNPTMTVAFAPASV